MRAEADPNAVNLARAFGKDIFELNGVPYLQPLVETLNATSNSRFFNQAYIPSNVDKPYFRVGGHAMFGFVREDMKTYIPSMPAEALDPNKLSKYIDIIPTINIKDTAGLIYYALKTILYDGIKRGMINVPKSSATILGYQNTKFFLPHDSLIKLVQEHPVYPLLPQAFKDSLINTIWKFPELFTLPPGANMNVILAGVPQIEIGALWGTELLIRYIPQVNMGENIGDFTFWGFGLKHSISQYFDKRYFDLATQIVYQGTKLKNKVGYTNSDLKAEGTFWDFNLHASKAFLDDMLNVYAGISYELFNINSNFIYTLPVETQLQLGLRDGYWKYSDDAKDSVFIINPVSEKFPGDTLPQTSNLRIVNTNLKFVFGLNYQIGPVAIFIDYNISKFNIFTGGVEVRF
ncbi:MAG: hypothetical protein HZB41_02000 [Ignavibacteriae bacterium]|nr:hypothetical protein [Ignavibacteriota bacterium]